jgi:hypothetical protein
MNGTIEQSNHVDVADVADTSDVEITTTEPSNDDNSEEQNTEPAETEQTTTDESEQQPENQQPENTAAKPKFETMEAALKGYENLEKKLGEQSNELGELRKKAEKADELQKLLDSQALQEANKNGFETVREFETHKEVIKAEADAYAKHIHECEFPDEMVKLLAEYRKNPSKELQETIESQFSNDILKEVAEKMAIFKGQLQYKEQEALQKEIESSARAYLDENVAKYKEDFNNPAFAALYGEAFRAYGCDLQTEKFVELMHQYRDEILKSANIKTEIDEENNSETDEIEGLTNTGNSSNNSNEIKGSLLNMSDRDMKAAISKLI